MQSVCLIRPPFLSQFKNLFRLARHYTMETPYWQPMLHAPLSTPLTINGKIPWILDQIRRG